MKKMRTLAIMAILGLAIPTLAQERGRSPEQREQLEALKIAFITEELNLSPDEAKAFWPVYNEMENQLKEIRRSKRENQKNAGANFDVMTDADIEKSMESGLTLSQQELDVKRDHVSKFKKVLPIRKVAKLYASEEIFKQRLLKRFKEKRKEGHRGGGKGL